MPQGEYKHVTKMGHAQIGVEEWRIFGEPLPESLPTKNLVILLDKMKKMWHLT